MDWVSSLAYSWKANGKLRVCLDPQDVNKAIKRDHYKTPTVEEITHLLAGSKKFTKVDGTSSYLCIVLNYESSLLMTFNTLWGRYKFVRLPWGLSCAQDFFSMDDGPEKRTQSSCGTLHTRKPSTRSRNWSVRTPHSGTLTFGNPSLSKLMHQRRDLELHSCKKDAQLPLLPKLLPLQSNDMPR